MVHALEEIRRILVPDGVLIDLRPLADRWPVEVKSGHAYREIGRLTDLPTGLADDEAANCAIKEATLQGWFVSESEWIFPFFYYWETPEEMREHIKEKWTDFMQLEEDIFSAVQSAWSATGADRRVRVRLKMLLTCWRKQ
jgi:SAM-dependent methyltransferase